MTQDQPKVGELHPLEPRLACVLAPNPSPMTFWGTNTYILGDQSLAVIDPGPLDDTHLQALLAAIGPRKLTHILVTHSHLDHSPLARPLADLTGAPVLAFGDSGAGRSAIMQDIAASGLIGGGEGVDDTFAPDIALADGANIDGDGWSLRAQHTPGHFGNHTCFQWGNAVFSGDLVMGWATSLVSPPDGDLTDFMASCRALAATGVTRAYCGHGPMIADAQARIAELLAHRTSRETEILATLAAGPATPETLTRAIYTDVAKPLLRMAERNVLAHLVDLTTRGHVAPIGSLSAASKFSLV